MAWTPHREQLKAEPFAFSAFFTRPFAQARLPLKRRPDCARSPAFLRVFLFRFYDPNRSRTSFTISSPIRFCASFVDAPMCGVMETFG